MASDSKKSNQAAGEGKQHCHRAHWLAVLGTMESMGVPEEWWSAELVGDWWKDLEMIGDSLRYWLLQQPCTCIDCQRRPRRSEDRNPHEGKVML